MKTFDRVLCIGLIRDSFVETSMRGSKKTQEEIFVEGISLIENVMDQSQTHSFVMRGLQRLDKEDEFLRLLRIHYSILNFKLPNHLGAKQRT